MRGYLFDLLHGASRLRTSASPPCRRGKKKHTNLGEAAPAAPASLSRHRKRIANAVFSRFKRFEKSGIPTHVAPQKVATSAFIGPLAAGSGDGFSTSTLSPHTGSNQLRGSLSSSSPFRPCYRLLGTDTFKQHGCRFVVRILGNEFATECFSQYALL